MSNRRSIDYYLASVQSKSETLYDLMLWFETTCPEKLKNLLSQRTHWFVPNWEPGADLDSWVLWHPESTNYWIDLLSKEKERLIKDRLYIKKEG